MRLVERHYIKKSHNSYEYCKNITHLAKNLYNAALYTNRQQFFHTGEYYNDFSISKQFTKENNPDYRALPTKVAKQIIRKVHQDFQSFFALLKSKQSGAYNKKVKIPSYKPTDGYTTVTFPQESISRKTVYDKNSKLYQHTVCTRDDDFRFNFISKIENVDNVRIVPKDNGTYFIIEVVYTVKDTDYKADNGRYASIDPGVNNIAAVFFNFDEESLLINGKPVKSVNQYYNKRKSAIQRNLQICNGTYISSRLSYLYKKRECKINDMLHKITRFLVNHIVSLDVCKVIVGKNNNWKQDIKIGKRNNQTFTSIPHTKLIHMLKYKLALEGIKLVTVEESYTSKCSALDKEDVCKHNTYVGTRVHRGLFETGDNTLINADINGAINIMRKVFPNESVYFDGIVDVAVHPRLYTVV